MVSIEGGCFIDKWERGEYSIDPRDLVKYTPPVEFGTVGIINRKTFNCLMGEASQIRAVELSKQEVKR